MTQITRNQGESKAFWVTEDSWGEGDGLSIAQTENGETWGNLIVVMVMQTRQFSSVQSLSYVCLCDRVDCSMPGLPNHHQLLEFTQTLVHQVGDAIQPSHPLSSPSPPALNLSQHQGLFQWVSSLHQVAKVLEFQLLHQSFQWKPRTDLL